MKIFKSKKRHWYRVKLIYQVQLKTIFETTFSCGFENQYDILNHRLLKKLRPPLHKTTENYKILLDNGILLVEPIVYLGYFKDKIKN